MLARRHKLLEYAYLARVVVAQLHKLVFLSWRAHLFEIKIVIHGFVQLRLFQLVPRRIFFQELDDNKVRQQNFFHSVLEPDHVLVRLLRMQKPREALAELSQLDRCPRLYEARAQLLQVVFAQLGLQQNHVFKLARQLLSIVAIQKEVYTAPDLE